MYTVEIQVYEKYLYYFLDKQYIGLLSFSDGKLSDFRANIRKNRWTITPHSFYKLTRTGLFELLTHYMTEAKFLPADEMQKVKSKIVRSAENVLKEAEQIVLEKIYLEVQDDS